MSVDKNSLVNPGDLLAAVRTIYGPDCKVLGWDVKQGTETVQGYASLMLRAKVKVKTRHGGVTEVNLMVKRQPTVSAQREMIESFGNIIAREGTFFSSILPRLQENSPNLPIVRALVAYKDAMVMEDLCDAGFQTIPKTMQDIGRGKVLTFPLARMCVRKLAKIHAASANEKWTKIMPVEYFDVDPMMDSKNAEQFQLFIGMTVQSIIIPLMKKMFLHTPSIDKFVEYLSSPLLLSKAIDSIKFDTKKGPNVLVHGDCHLNNMMFKLDDNGNPIDMRFIDFQLARYGQATTDLVYFLYTSAGKEFREKYEIDLIRAYVEAFNSELCVTPDLIDFDNFWKSYEKARYYGLVIALGIRPMQFLPAFAAPSDGELTEEFFDMDRIANIPVLAAAAYENDELFKEEMDGLIPHAMAVMNEYVFVE
ncbi:uncharacterized protein LOC132203888 [Neocloeon triangulifer]|uniref:uncharacterized protein LOC132203888 n=1 Tax=Neocloeon triangulifer TaxID=2078957 RepID=UPI00286F2B91|nr:uncharacterized protein LOC132203888 [Neocloeon triangulifer]